MGNSVHRIVEQRAAATPDAIAIVDGARVTTYRELNAQANALARQLCASGLTRGTLAIVRMPCGIDLAVVLLAILKAGACYAWAGASDNGLPSRVCLLRRTSGFEDEYTAIDIERALRGDTSRTSPNLPILTRARDMACVLPDAMGRPAVLVPHATIAALPHPCGTLHTWSASPGALELWAGLMAGITLSVGLDAPATAAA